MEKKDEKKRCVCVYILARIALAKNKALSQVSVINIFNIGRRMRKKNHSLEVYFQIDEHFFCKRREYSN